MIRSEHPPYGFYIHNKNSLCNHKKKKFYALYVCIVYVECYRNQEHAIQSFITEEKKNRKILCTQYGNGKWRKIQCIHPIPHIVCYNVIVKFKSIFLDFVQALQCERQQHWDVMMIKIKTNKHTSNGIFKYKNGRWLKW